MPEIAASGSRLYHFIFGSIIVEENDGAPYPFVERVWRA